MLTRVFVKIQKNSSICSDILNAYSRQEPAHHRIKWSSHSTDGLWRVRERERERATEELYSRYTRLHISLLEAELGVGIGAVS